MTAHELLAANPNAAEIMIERAELVYVVERLEQRCREIDDLHSDVRRLERQRDERVDGARKHVARLVELAHDRADTYDLDDPLHDVLDLAKRAIGCLDG